MQTNNRKEIAVTAMFTAAFLLGGFIHVIIDPWDFTSCITQIYYSSLVLAWAVTVNNRIVNKMERRLMLMTAALFMLAFCLQMIRYRIFETFLTACRYCWYGYYIPAMLTPVLFLFIVLHLHLQENEKPNRYWLLMLIPSMFFICLVMTNDLHQLVFFFTDGTNGKNGTYTHGILYYAMYIWIIAVLVLALYLAVRQCRIPSISRKLWMPLYFAAFGIFIILSLFEATTVGDVQVWLFIESLAMVIIGMEEACIQLGLIPANSSYRMIASEANKPFIISDGTGTTVYTSEAAKEMFQRKENIQIHTKPIRGGNVSWAVDLTDMVELNRKIEETTEIIETRNAYLQTENSLKEEQSRLTARNSLYNQIAAIVRPQLDTIGRLLEGTDNDENLAKIAFVNAYIKRRSNMELLKFDKMHFPTEELVSAIRESCEYLKLCGVNAVLHIMPECELSADTQLYLYEAFETVVESCIDTLQMLLVNITMHSFQPVLRIALKASEQDIDALVKQLSANDAAVAEADGEELTVTITRQEGGVGL